MSQPRPRFKTSFKASKTYSPIHTGGDVALSGDGSWLVSTLDEQALVTEIETGTPLKELKGDTSAVTTLTITPQPLSPQEGGFILTCHRSLSLHIYSLPTLSLHRHVPKAHEAPIITSCSDPTGTLFATGSADGTIKVWDADKGHCTHVLKGHGGVISGLKFDIASVGDGGRQGRARLISGADDCKIRVWDLRRGSSNGKNKGGGECLHVLDGHNSVVRGLDVTRDGKTLISGGRDKIVNVWDLERGVLRRTMPVFETLESVGLVEIDDQVEGSGGSKKGKEKEGEDESLKRKAIFTGGDKGIVRLWDLLTGQEIKTRQEKVVEGGKVHEILQIINTPSTSTLTAIYVDQNIVTRTLPHLSTTRQIIGFNDEVIDTCFLSPFPSTSSTSTSTSSSSERPESHLAVATNSDLIRVYDLERFNTTLLEGHEDVVLCLSRSSDGRILVSGSKDKTARVWYSTPPPPSPSSTTTPNAPQQQQPRWKCVGKASGHVESIGAVAVSKRDRNFIVTASQDRTAKIWDLASIVPSKDAEEEEEEAEDEEKEMGSLRAMSTTKIHDKDINTLDISPNDRFLASGSQDRTAKLFSIDYTPKSKSHPSTAQLNLLGTFKGHKRGVWSVKFSPVDQCLATASGDRTVKLWSLQDFTCVKTFEGHSNTVLRCDFLTRGMQLVSCASDGLVKVWNVKDEECVATLDNHEEKIWALAISKDEKHVVSGGADSVINVWEDITESEELEKIQEQEELVLKEQDYENYLSINDYSNAILLALSMDQPRRLLKLFTEVKLNSGSTTTSTDPTSDLESYTGNRHVDQVVRQLSKKDLRQLLGYVKDWNTVSRSSDVAQGVLHAIFKFHDAEVVLAALEGRGESNDEDGDEEVLDLDGMLDDAQQASKKKKKGNAGSKDTAGDVLGALIPYTERHMTRADKLVRESFIVEHLLGLMEGFDDFDVTNGGEDGMEVDQQ